MSTRYVWNKQNLTGADSQTRVEVIRGRYSQSFVSSTVVGYCCSSITQVKDTSGNITGWKAGGQITPLYFGGFVNTTTYPYFVADNTGVVDTYGSTSWTGYFWYGINDYSSGGGNYGGANILSDKTNLNLRIEFTKHTFEYAGGTVISKVSSASKASYPTNSGGGKKEDYWYTYLGSDTIDPTGITYPTDQLRPGDIVNAAISPRAPTYGGTISYLYQYQINGGSWVNIQTTTATSIDFTIPANAKTIRFRVRAQDNMGFTSATYVTGASVTVERLNAWIGVNGKARKGVELYVGVNGKARKVTAAYIGVNGKARRFL